MLRFAVTPVCCFLSYWCYVLPSPLCLVEGDLGFLSSMWLMYLVMAAAHSGPWLALSSHWLTRSTRNGDAN